MTKTRGGLLVAAVAAVALAIPALVFAGGTSLTANLTGEQEVPAGSGAPNGQGSVDVDLKPKRKEVCFDLTFSGIAGKATSSAIFAGKKGETGATKVLFFDTPTQSPVSDCVKAKKKLLKKIKRMPRQYHVNVESKKYPAGAIRGQLKKG